MLDLHELDPFLLSRELARLKGRHDSFLGGLAERPAVHDPFLEREFPGRAVHEWVLALHPSDPMRFALLRWVRRLTDERIHVHWSCLEADLLYREQHSITEPQIIRTSLDSMRRQALALGGDDADAFWNSFARYEAALSAHRAEWFARHAEVAFRLGVPPAEQVLSPVGSPQLRTPPLPSLVEGQEGFVESAATDLKIADAQSPHRDPLVSLAERVLSTSKDAASQLWEPTWSAAVEASLARSATESWPGRLAPDTLRDLLGAPGLFRSTTIALGRLPQRISPMSFPRALYQVGCALSAGLVPGDLPFAVQRDPDDLFGESVGRLFFLWSLSRTFARRVLGLSGPNAAEHVRVFTTALVAETRLAALRYLTGVAARRGSSHLREVFPSLTADHLGQAMAPEAALGRWKVKSNEGARFAALLYAFSREEELTNTYDEDWLHSPRVQERLRSDLSRPAPVAHPEGVYEAGLAAFAARCQ